MFVRLCAIALTTFLAYDLVRFPFVPRFAHSLGAGPLLIGVVVSASTVTGIFSKWFFGALSDELDRRRLLLCSSCIAAVLPLAYLVVRDVRLLIGVRLLHGLTTAILAPVMRAAVSDLIARHERGVKLGTYASAAQVGMSAGRWAGGLLLFWGGFHCPLIAASIAGVVAVRLVWTWPQAHRQAPRPAAWRTTFRKMLHGVMQNRGTGPILLVSGIEASIFLSRGMIEAFLPIYAIEVAGLHDGHVGTLFGLQLLMLVLVRPAMGLWSDRVGRLPLIGGGLLVSAAIMWWIPRTTTFLGLALLFMGWSIGIAMVSASSLAMITDIADRHTRQQGPARYGTSHGLFGTCVDIGHAAGPILGGILISRFAYAGAFSMLSCGLVVMALVMIWPLRRWSTA